MTNIEKATALEKAANAARASIQEALKHTLERDLLVQKNAIPVRFNKVDTVWDTLDTETLARSDAELLSVGDLDDEARFQVFAEKLMRLKNPRVSSRALGQAYEDQSE